MTLTFDAVNIPQAVISNPDWGQNRDIEHESIITGVRNWDTLGDHAEIVMTVYLWKCTAGEKTAVANMHRQEKTLVTPFGSGTFRCFVRYGLLNGLDDKQIAILTFKSKNYIS